MATTRREKGTKAESPTTRKSKNRQTSTHGTFEQLIAPHPPDTQAIALRLREIVYEVLPKAEETVWTGGWKLALYKDVSEICGIQPGKGYCNFYLTRGAELPDPDGLLEGRGKSIRHVKVRSLNDMPAQAIKELIRAGEALAKRT